jgi:hypothetical protein
MKLLFAIMRHDIFQADICPVEDRVSFVKIVNMTRNEVNAEVERLNGLRSEPDTVLYWRQTISIGRLPVGEIRAGLSS